MRDMIRRKRNRKGFTLAEMLVVVAILIILAGVSFVSVSQYQKNLRLMELDGTAKEIFIAAQNHLSLAKASGDLDRLGEDELGTKLSAAPAYAEDDGKGSYYYLIHNAVKGTESYLPEKAGEVCSLLLPYGAVDETVAAGGNYIVVYEKNSGTVVAVLYSGAGNASFGNQAVITFDAEDVLQIEQVYGDAHKDERKSYKKGDTTAIVGCYTGAASTAPLPAKELKTPTVEVKNENRLHVIVDDTPFHTDEDQLTLVIYGQTSKTTAKKVLDRLDVNIYAFTQYQFDVTLDDITGDGNLRFTKLLDADANRGFKKSNDSEGNDFIPGENIEIYVIASSKDALATPKKSTVYTVSSLFGDQNDGTTVYIKNLRHLENLGGNISDFKGKLGANGAAAAITAEQKTDITMFSVKNTGADSANTAVFVDLDGKELSASYIYNMTANDQPRHHIYAAADIDYPLVYHGNGNEIKELSIGAQQNHADAGIFGKVENPAADEGEGSRLNASLEVKDLILRNNKIPSSSTAQPTNAGMLVGSASADLTVNGVLAYYHEDTYSEEKDSATEVSASGAAGGLIGLVSGGKLTVTNSAAAVYVKGGSAAGGLIGEITTSIKSGSTITQSYAGGHTKDGKYTEVSGTDGLSGVGRVNVQASDATGYAGGLLGVYTGSNLTMEAAYSTASAYAATAANSGSLVGKGANNPTVTGAVSAVKVGGSDAGGYVIIKKDSDKKPNYYAVGTHNGTAASSDDIAKAVLSSDAKRRQATPYDRELLPKNGDTAETDMKKTSYPLYSAGQLAGKLSVDSKTKDSDDSKDLPWFMKEHVGDWVVPSSTESNFKVINGNRLTVRITDEALAADQGEQNYSIQVQGVESNQVKYFLLQVKDGKIATIVRGDNANYSDNYQNNVTLLDASKKSGESYVDFYIDDITRADGHFINVMDNYSFIVGEDIKVNVVKLASVRYESYVYTVQGDNFDPADEVLTNSVFGSFDGEQSPAYSKLSEDEKNHNKRKTDSIAAAKISSDFDVTKSMGLLPSGGNYYVQIDNSRHLENLSWAISGLNASPTVFGKIEGVIQTDNIYWSGSTHLDSYTESFVEELKDAGGTAPTVYGSAAATGVGKFCPIGQNTNRGDLSFRYNGSNFKISGLNIDYSLEAGLFGTLSVNTSIQNLNIENADIKGTTTGALIGLSYGKKIEINKVYLTRNGSGNNTIKGRGTTGGFVGSAGGEVDIQNSGINGTTEITSTGTNAGGLVGSASNKVTIDQATFDAQVTVTAEASDAKAGGFIGSTGNQSNTVEIKNSSINQKTTVVASNGYAAGIVAYADWNVPINITAVKANGDLSTTGSKVAGGFVGFTQGSSLTISGSELNQATVISNAKDSKAAGLVADAQCGVTITGTKLNGDLTVNGSTVAAGFVGSAVQKVTITNCELGKAYIGLNSDGTASGTVAQKVAGLIADATGEAEIKGTQIVNQVQVMGSSAAGGFVGTATNTVTIAKDATTACELKDTASLTVTATSGRAAGLIAEATGNTGTVSISDMSMSGKLTVSGTSESGGFIGTAAKKVTITEGVLNTAAVTSTSNKAAGFVANASSAVEIKNTKINGRLSVTGSSETGGFIGYTNGAVTINNSAVLDAYIKSNGSRAGGLVAVTAGNTITVDKVKVIGQNTEIRGRNTTGGLFGRLEARTANISNAAVSAFIMAGQTSSENSNAGGLIGEMDLTGSSSSIKRSYYGGRTVNGQYGTIQLPYGGNEGNRYEANIIGYQAVGGVIGWITGSLNNLNISQCFTTGSVKTLCDNAQNGMSAGGFFGSIHNANITMTDCYAMGNVTGTERAGFIGSTGLNAGRYSPKLVCTNVYYFNAFNDADISSKFYGKHYCPSNWGNPATSFTISGQSIVTNIDNLKGTSDDLSGKTVAYDSTLKDDAYPYKNWASLIDEDDSTGSDKIIYYGDWPNYDGTFVYWAFADGTKHEQGGEVNFNCYNGGTFTSNVTPVSGHKFTEKAAFGILIKTTHNRSDVQGLYYYGKDTYNFSEITGIEGADKKNKYFDLNCFEDDYYFLRITTPELTDVPFYIRKGSNGPIYKVSKDSKTSKIIFELQS